MIVGHVRAHASQCVVEIAAATKARLRAWRPPTTTNAGSRVWTDPHPFQVYLSPGLAQVLERLLTVTAATASPSTPASYPSATSARLDLEALLCSPPTPSLSASGDIPRLTSRTPRPRAADEPPSAGGLGDVSLPGAASDAWSAGLPRRLRGKAVRRPAYTSVEIQQLEGGGLAVTIPAGGASGQVLASAGFTVAWNAGIGVWTAAALTGGAPLLFTAFSLPFWLVGACFVDNVRVEGT